MTDVESIKRLYRHWTDTLADNPSMSISGMRAMYDEWGSLSAEAEQVTVTKVLLGGVPCMQIRPDRCDSDRILLCLHGGGFSVGSTASHRKLFSHIALASKAIAIVPEYSLAPEYPYPCALNEIVAVQSALSREYSSAQQVCVGDSAGGGLVVSLLHRLHAGCDGYPVTAILMSPWLDMKVTGTSVLGNTDKDVLVTKKSLRAMARNYLADTTLDDPAANPLMADCTLFPPVYIQVGADEALLDDALTMAERWRKSGAQAELDIFPQMQHVFQFMVGHSGVADDAINRIGQWIDRQMSSV